MPTEVADGVWAKLAGTPVMRSVAAYTLPYSCPLAACGERQRNPLTTLGGCVAVKDRGRQVQAPGPA